MSRLNRRRFMQTSAVGTGLIIAGTKASGAVLGANDRVRIAVAGLNGRGNAHISGWLGQDNVELAYLCDPDKKILDGKLKKRFAKGGRQIRYQRSGRHPRGARR